MKSRTKSVRKEAFGKRLFNSLFLPMLEEHYSEFLNVVPESLLWIIAEYFISFDMFICCPMSKKPLIDPAYILHPAMTKIVYDKETLLDAIDQGKFDHIEPNRQMLKDIHIQRFSGLKDFSLYSINKFVEYFSSSKKLYYQFPKLALKEDKEAKDSGSEHEALTFISDIQKSLNVNLSHEIQFTLMEEAKIYGYDAIDFIEFFKRFAGFPVVLCQYVNDDKDEIWRNAKNFHHSFDLNLIAFFRARGVPYSLANITRFAIHFATVYFNHIKEHHTHFGFSIPYLATLYEYLACTNFLYFRNVKRFVSAFGITFEKQPDRLMRWAALYFAFAAEKILPCANYVDYVRLFTRVLLLHPHHIATTDIVLKRKKPSSTMTHVVTAASLFSYMLVQYQTHLSGNEEGSSYAKMLSHLVIMPLLHVPSLMLGSEQLVKDCKTALQHGPREWLRPKRDCLGFSEPMVFETYHRKTCTVLIPLLFTLVSALEEDHPWWQLAATFLFYLVTMSTFQAPELQWSPRTFSLLSRQDRPLGLIAEDKDRHNPADSKSARY